MTESLHFFPPLNASLNALSGIFLLAGIAMIKKGNRRAHGACMIAAVTTSVVFLICYVTYHYLKGGMVTRFPLEYPGWRRFYLAILISHTILAVINVPLVVMTVTFAAKEKFEKHKRIARWTFPIWLYVSVTGVLVYFMLYQWFPQKAAVAENLEEATTAAVSSGGLVFDTEVFSYKADPSEKQFTATFHIRNEGPKKVTITKLDTSCTCLSVTADRMEMDPGSESTLTAVFDIAKLSGESEKNILVMTDDPDMPRKRLAVEVSVPPIVEISPTIAEWTVGEKLQTREIVFKVLRTEPIRILEATSSRRQVSLEMKTIEEGREYRLILTPEATDDILLGFVSIKTDCELEQHQRMMAYFAVKDPYN
jgi:putative membrane protein